MRLNASRFCGIALTLIMLLTSCRSKPAAPEPEPEAAAPTPTSLVEGYLDPAATDDQRAAFATKIWEAYEMAPMSRKTEIREAFRVGLGAESALTRRLALKTLSELVGDEVADVAVKWLTAPEAADVRDAAIACVHKLNLRDHAAALRGFLSDKNPDVQIAAIKALSAWGDVQSKAAFEEAAKSTDVRVQRTAKGALRRLERVRK